MLLFCCCENGLSLALCKSEHRGLRCASCLDNHYHDQRLTSQLADLCRPGMRYRQIHTPPFHTGRDQRNRLRHLPNHGLGRSGYLPILATSNAALQRSRLQCPRLAPSIGRPHFRSSLLSVVPQLRRQRARIDQHVPRHRVTDGSRWQVRRADD